MILYQGHQIITLPAGHQLTLIADAFSSGIVYRRGVVQSAVAVSTTVVIGPFPTTESCDVVVAAGFLDVTSGPSLLQRDATILTQQLADGAVTSAKLADDIAHTVTVAVSSAEILALNATPKALVAAPGANKILLLESIILEATRTATAYLNGGVVEVRYENAAGALAAATFPASLITGGAGVAVAHNIGLATILTPLVNKALVLHVATAEFDTGTGTLRALLKYRVVAAG